MIKLPLPTKLVLALLGATMPLHIAQAQGVAEFAQALNAQRVQPASCGTGAISGAAPLRLDQALSRGAAALAASGGGRGDLRAILDKAGYRARQSMLLQLSGLSEPVALAQYASQSFCAALRSPDYADFGIYQQGSGASARTFIVLARPHGLPQADARSQAEIGQRVLTLVNQARTEPRRCGGQSFGAAAPLAWDEKLAAAARAHSEEMAQLRNLSHTGRDGKSVDARVTRAGYAWRFVAENIAAGQPSAEEVTAGWIASPGHCANLMSPKATVMGAAFALAPGSDMGIYWTQVFASPR
jgi:uncharacterized protein YkwD